MAKHKDIYTALFACEFKTISTDGENKRFAKVERENLIVKQKEMDLTVIGF